MQLIIAIFVAALIYMWQQNVYKRNWDKNLDVDISFKDSYINAGEKSALIEVISNGKFLPLPVFHVKFSAEKSFCFTNHDNAAVTDSYHRNDAFSIMGNQKITRNLEFCASKRGVFSISGVTVTAKDFFMTNSFVMTVDCHDMIYVFPRKISVPQLDTFFNKILGELETAKGLIEDPYTFRGIREYNRRDNMNHINWKASAKTGELMVNQYGYTWEPRVKLLINLDTKSMVKGDYFYELSMEIASSMACFFLENNIPVALEANAYDIDKLPLGSIASGSNIEHMITVDKYLASVCEGGDSEEFFGIINGLVDAYDNDYTYIIISPYHREDLLIKLDYLKSKGMELHMIVPYLDTKGIKDKRDYMYEWEVKLHEI